ncbi:Rha family transcriptional regulator, partial [Komagataeibacter europaeus]
MTTATAAITTIPLTMSSREIAGLTGKEHRHVRRDIKKMLANLGLTENGYAQTWTDPQNGQEYEEYALPKNLTLNLIAGYRDDMRLKIIDRWMELEAQERKPLVPQTYAEALLEAGRIAKERDALKAENRELAVKAEALDRISFAEGEFGQHEVAKMIQVKPGVFTKF